MKPMAAALTGALISGVAMYAVGARAQNPNPAPDPQAPPPSQQNPPQNPDSPQQAPDPNAQSAQPAPPLPVEQNAPAVQPNATDQPQTQPQAETSTQESSATTRQSGVTKKSTKATQSKKTKKPAEPAPAAPAEPNKSAAAAAGVGAGSDTSALPPSGTGSTGEPPAANAIEPPPPPPPQGDTVADVEVEKRVERSSRGAWVIPAVFAIGLVGVAILWARRKREEEKISIFDRSAPAPVSRRTALPHNP